MTTRKARRYTQLELDLLKSLYERPVSPRLIARILKRGTDDKAANAIGTNANRLGFKRLNGYPKGDNLSNVEFKRGNGYSDEDVALLRKLYEIGANQKDMGLVLGRAASSVRVALAEYGIAHTPAPAQLEPEEPLSAPVRNKPFRVAPKKMGGGLFGRCGDTSCAGFVQ